MKKKVFIIIPTLGTGGAEKLVIDIAKNIDKSEIDLTIVVLFPKSNTIYEIEAERENLNVIYLNKKLGFDIKVILKLNKLIKRNRPDVVHTHLNTIPYALLGVISTKVKTRIHTVHNIANKDAVGINRLINKIAYKIFKFKPIAISEYIKKTIIDTYSLNEMDIECIYNGIDTNKFKSKKEKMHSENIKIISVASFKEKKIMI